MGVVLIPVRMTRQTVGDLGTLDDQILRDPRLATSRKEGLVSAEVLRRGDRGGDGLLMVRWDNEPEGAPDRLLESIQREPLRADMEIVADQGDVYYGDQ